MSSPDSKTRYESQLSRMLGVLGGLSSGDFDGGSAMLILSGSWTFTEVQRQNRRAAE